MEKEYWEIERGTAAQVRDSAWSIDAMEGHGADGRSVTYIGSMDDGQLDNSGRRGKMINDYYRDSEGKYWYGNRVQLPDGRLVSMEVYLFGRELKRQTRSKRRKRK